MEVKRVARGSRPHGKFAKWDLWDEIPRDNLPPVPTYTCRKTKHSMRIDGRLDEEAWQRADLAGPFCDINTGEQPTLDTRIALLWDDENLYVGAKLEDHDIRASMTGFHEHVYQKDEDLEIFIAGENDYYEVGVNAINTVYEIRWTSVDAVIQNEDWPRIEELLKTPNSLFYIFEKGKPRSRHGDLDWTLEGLQHAVFIDGSLNRPEIKDSGWTVEFAIPWKGLQPIMGKKACPPRPGDVLRMNSYRAHHLRSRDDQINRWESWTWSLQGCNLIHRPERWAKVVFVDEEL